jgi:hypothetical protein
MGSFVIFKNLLQGKRDHKPSLLYTYLPIRGMPHIPGNSVYTLSCPREALAGAPSTVELPVEVWAIVCSYLRVTTNDLLRLAAACWTLRPHALATVEHHSFNDLANTGTLRSPHWNSCGATITVAPLPATAANQLRAVGGDLLR